MSVVRHAESRNVHAERAVETKIFPTNLFRVLATISRRKESILVTRARLAAGAAKTREENATKTAKNFMSSRRTRTVNNRNVKEEVERQDGLAPQGLETLALYYSRAPLDFIKRKMVSSNEQHVDDPVYVGDTPSSRYALET